jgi:hypothetical protein
MPKDEKRNEPISLASINDPDNFVETLVTLVRAVWDIIRLFL